MRLVTLNIASGRDADGVVRLSHLAESVAALDADVVALQEVDRLLPRSSHLDQAVVVGEVCGVAGSPWAVHFAAALEGGTPGPGGGAGPARSTRPGVPSYGNALLSRHPLEDVRELRLAPARGRRPIPLPPGTRPPVWFLADEQRVAIAATAHGPAGPLTIVAAHLSFAPGRAALQLRRIRTWVADLPRPLLLLGDLNLPGPVPPLLTGWTSLLRAPTFPADAPRLQLDHVLADGAVTVRSAEAVRVGGSDHRALVVDLEPLPGRTTR